MKGYNTQILFHGEPQCGTLICIVACLFRVVNKNFDSFVQKFNLLETVSGLRMAVLRGVEIREYKQNRPLNAEFLRGGHMFS